jgi:quercetin dioxygenase-like cupin family protein
MIREIHIMLKKCYFLQQVHFICLYVCRAISCALLVLAGFGTSSDAFAQNAGPTDNKGTSSRVLGVIDLTNEGEGLTGRQLRSRHITIEPGGHAAVHSHAGRPTLEYVAQGHVVEIRNGVEVTHGPGEMVVATHDITHGWENRGTETVVLIPVDLFKQ